MKLIPSHLLPECEALAHGLYTRLGVALFEPGETFYSEHRDVLHECNVNEVYVLEDGDEPPQPDTNMVGEKKITVELGKARAFHRLSQPVYNDEGVLLARAGEYIASKLRIRLLAHGIREVEVLLDSFKSSEDQFRKAKRAVNDRHDQRRIMAVRIQKARLLLEGEPVKPGAIPALAAGVVAEAPVGARALSGDMREVELGSKREEEVLARYREDYASCLGSVGELFAALEKGQVRDVDDLQRLLNRLIVLLVRDRDLYTQLTNMKREGDALVQHSLHVALLSINLATVMGFPHESVLEIACCAVLADIGMLRVPREIRMKPGPLTEGEREIVQRHPSFSLELLAQLKNVPRSVPVVLFQIHERLNGGGYPQGLTERDIHPFSRLVAVADVYSALVEERPHRKALAGPDAMETMLEMVKDDLLDRDGVDALIRLLSVYPLGTWLELDNGNLGPVIAANPSLGARPVVKVVYKKRGAQPLKRARLINLATAPEREVRAYFDGGELAEDVFIGF